MKWGKKMDRTITYLEEKNMYLEKFLGLNSQWLEKLTKEDFGELEEFRENREDILNIIRHLDALIEARVQSTEVAIVDTAIKSQINGILARKDSLVKAILSQDLDIMQIIDVAKTQVIHDLRNVQKGKKTISSYKSYNRKDTIDEEA
jgi:hypothetical protein